MNHSSGELAFRQDIYSEHDRNWQKSVNEYAKFILDHLDKPNFIEFIVGDNQESGLERWNLRLEELFDKATSRIGHHIEESELRIKALEIIVKQKNNGELPDSKFLNRFISEVSKVLPEVL